jgi:ferredoxin--NADP+ reductase
MNLREFDISHRYPATLLSSHRITPIDIEPEVRHLVLKLPKGGLEYLEGQSIGVLTPGPHPFGNSIHFRLYSIASPREGENHCKDTISICVRRCVYIDDVSGEAYPGRSSNYLCNARPGDTIDITGPYGIAFSVPTDETCNLLMVGTGTGIAPFRAFVKHIYGEHKGWKGKVRLFYGAKTGMELLYLNDMKKDLDLYYDQGSFRAFEALSPRPAFDAPPALERALLENSKEVWEMVQDPKTFVYIAGLMPAAQTFEHAMAVTAGSAEAWRGTHAQLVTEGRLSELLYE